MRVTLRLYRQFDIDLIYLAHHQDFSLIRTVKACMFSYITGEAYRISMPYGQMYSGAEDRTVYTYAFTLDEKDPVDAEIMKLLRMVRHRHRNAFMKNLLRGYMVAPCAEAYLTKDKKVVRSSTEAFEDLSREKDTRRPVPKSKTAGRMADDGQMARRKSAAKKKEIVVEEKKKAAEPKTPKKKKNAIEALGSIMLKPRATDALPNDDEQAENEQEPERKSAMFPNGAPDMPEKNTGGISEQDESFDVFGAVQDMMKQY